MAKLERYELQVKQQGLSIGPGSLISPTHVSGAGEIVEGANAIQGALGKFYKVQEEERQKAEAFVIADADLKFAQEAGDLLYNSETGALNAQGENALNTAKVHTKIEETRQKYIAGLSTPEAQRAFDLRSRVRAEAFRDTVERHAGAERNKLYASTAKNAQVETERQAALNYRSLGDVETLITLNSDTQRTALRLAGVPADQIETMIKESEASVYTAVLGEYKSRAANDPAEWEHGLVFLTSVEDSLGPHAQNIREVFEKGAAPVQIKREGDKYFDAIMEANTEGGTKRFNYDDALAFFRNIDAGLQTKYGPRIEERLRDEANAQAREDVQRISRVDEVLAAGGGYESHPDFLALDDKGKQTVRALQRTYNREKRADRSQARYEQAQLNAAALGDLVMLGAEEIEKLSDADLKSKFPDVNASGRLALRKAVQAAKVAVQKGDAISHDAIADRAQAIALTLYPQVKSKAHEKLRTEFINNTMAWWGGEFMKDPKNPTAPGKEEVADYLAKQLTMYDFPKAWNNPFGADKYWSAMTPEERIKYADKRLPLAQQPQAALVARAFGQPVPPTPGTAAATPAVAPSTKRKVGDSYTDKNGVKYRISGINPDGSYAAEKVTQ